MNQKESEVLIGGTTGGISSDLKQSPPFLFPPIQQKQLQIRTQSNTSHFIPNQPQPHPNPNLTLQSPRQNYFHHDPISKTPSASQNLHSTPHKRPVMIQTPSMLSHSPTLASLNNHDHQTLNIQSSSPPVSRFAASYTSPFAQRSVVLRFLHLLQCTRLLRARYRILILLSLPTLYFSITNPRRSFIIDLLSLLSLSAAFLISLNFALPRFPSIRLFLARSFPLKLCASSCASKPCQPVLWSIGSKPKSVKGPNSGAWVQVYGNGDVYEGEFHKGKCSGSGVYYYHLNGKYEGDWVDEKYDGYGVETWAKGSRYRGQYRQGLRHGVGFYRFYTGDVYAGEWSNGQCHGCGVHTCEDGSQYIGEFKWGVKHGLGRYHFRNGDTYAGQYFADKMHGFGVYQFGNGHRYEGAWHEGRRQGLGIYTFRNGETQSGHWQNGVLDIPCTQLLTHPESPYGVNSTKVLNAVQEARGAAEKTLDIGKVDERVNKAVAAANKAANAARVASVKAVQNRMHLGNYNDRSPIQPVCPYSYRPHAPTTKRPLA